MTSDEVKAREAESAYQYAVYGEIANKIICALVHPDGRSPKGGQPQWKLYATFDFYRHAEDVVNLIQAEQKRTAA